MDHSQDFAVGFRLSPPALRLSVAVQLRSAGERWVAVADIEDRRQTGIGRTPREALTAALGSLDRVAITALLADPALLEPSCAIAAIAGG